jgi:hypothetical protein
LRISTPSPLQGMLRGFFWSPSLGAPFAVLIFMCGPRPLISTISSLPYDSRFTFEGDTNAHSNAVDNAAHYLWRKGGGGQGFHRTGRVLCACSVSLQQVWLEQVCYSRSVRP